MSDDELKQELDLEHGPCMAALSEKRRALVMAMARDPLGTYADWAKEAGYSPKSGGLRVRAHAAIHDPKVQAAIMEVSRALLGARGPLLAITGLIAIAENPKHPQHVRVLELLANRTGFNEKQQIEVVHRDLTGDALLERIRFLAEKHKVDLGSLPLDMGPQSPLAIEHEAPADPVDASELDAKRLGDDR